MSPKKSAETKKVKEVKEVKKVKKTVEPEVVEEQVESEVVEEINNSEEIIDEKKMPSTYIQAVGRRKTSTARIRLYDGKGLITVNGMTAADYFKPVGGSFKQTLDRPFNSLGRRNKFDASIKVVGGGIRSQLGAVVHAISRALDKYNPEDFHRVLKKHGLLTRDPRMKERRKYGLMGARKRKSSPKR